VKTEPGTPAVAAGDDQTDYDLTFEFGPTQRLRLNPAAYRVRVNAGRVRRTAKLSDIPKVRVAPLAQSRPLRDRFDILAVDNEPLPLIPEVWLPSNADCDGDAKLPGDRKRGDGEIWHVHFIERTLTAWHRRPDGSDVESTQLGGTVAPVAFLGVTRDLDELFTR
jgi:hypothetical protein